MRKKGNNKAHAYLLTFAKRNKEINLITYKDEGEWDQQGKGKTVTSLYMPLHGVGFWKHASVLHTQKSKIKSSGTGKLTKTECKQK